MGQECKSGYQRDDTCGLLKSNSLACKRILQRVGFYNKKLCTVCEDLDFRSRAVEVFVRFSCGDVAPDDLSAKYPPKFVAGHLDP
jgi:hypothetical protein